MVRIATSISVVELAGHDEEVSLSLGSMGEELMEETHIFKVVKDQKPGDLFLVHGGMNLAGNVMGGFVVVLQRWGGCIAAGGFSKM